MAFVQKKNTSLVVVWGPRLTHATTHKHRSTSAVVCADWHSIICARTLLQITFGPGNAIGPTIRWCGCFSAYSAKNTHFSSVKSPGNFLFFTCFSYVGVCILHFIFDLAPFLCALFGRSAEEWRLQSPSARAPCVICNNAMKIGQIMCAHAVFVIIGREMWPVP